MRVTYKIQKGIHKEKCDDSALIGGQTMNDVSGSMEIKLPDKILIGDGVGGNAGGYEASMFVMNQAAGMQCQGSVEEIRERLLNINSRLLEYAKSIPGYERMATTVTGLLFESDQTIMVHCGNTRIYSLQGSFLKQMTVDQTTYQWLISIGNDMAAENCNKSEIRGAFGGGTPKQADKLTVERVFERVIPQVILMTSDGIHDVLELDDMEEIVSDRQKTSEEKLESLVELAVKKGSLDDCTAVLIESPAVTAS